MKKSRLATEEAYLTESIKPRMEYLRNHPNTLDDFLAFVKERSGVLPTKMMPRLRMTWSGRTPTALMISAIVEYFATGRHLGAVIEKVQGKTFIAPQKEMAQLQKTILGLKCADMIVSVKLRRRLIGWWLDLCTMGPPAGWDDLGFNAQKAYLNGPKFPDFPDTYTMTTGERACVDAPWSQDYDILAVGEREAEENSSDWSYYIRQAIILLDYAFHRAKATLQTPGFSAYHLPDIREALHGKSDSLGRPAHERLLSLTDDAICLFFHLEKELSPALAADLTTILDDLRDRSRHLRAGYLSNWTYTEDSTVGFLDPSLRQEYFALHTRVARELAFLMEKHQAEVVSLIDKALASLPPLEEKLLPHHDDLRQVGMESPTKVHHDQLVPLTPKELRTVIEAYDYPDDLLVICNVLEKVFSGKKLKLEEVSDPQYGGRIMIGLQALLLFSLAYRVEVPIYENGNWVDITFGSGKKKVTLPLKCEAGQARAFNIHQGKDSDILMHTAQYHIGNDSTSLGALICHLRRVGKLPPLPKRIK